MNLALAVQIILTRAWGIFRTVFHALVVELNAWLPLEYDLRLSNHRAADWAYSPQIRIKCLCWRLDLSIDVAPLR